MVPVTLGIFLQIVYIMASFTITPIWKWTKCLWVVNRVNNGYMRGISNGERSWGWTTKQWENVEEPSMCTKKGGKSIRVGCVPQHGSYIMSWERHVSKMAKIIYLSEFLDDKRMIIDEIIFFFYQWNSYS